MYVIIGGWQVGDINLRRVLSFDEGGFLFSFEAIEGRDTRHSLQLDKLERLRGTTQHLEWKDYDGAVSRGIGSFEQIKAITQEASDGKQITLYSCTVHPVE